jgi:ferritin-like metal-binding protein YciE
MKNTDSSISNKSNNTSEYNSGDSTSQKQGGKTIADVFETELKDIYNAEKQLVKAIPEMAEAASSEDLKQAFEDHLEETKEHVKRIEKAFSILGIDREEETCEAMEGLIKEGKEIIDEFEEGEVRDCALIIGAQKIEHYEIAAYGSLCELAEVMGKHRVADLLDETLEEEENADKKLTEVAEMVNDGAIA